MSRPATDAELSWLDQLGDDASQGRVRRLTALDAVLLPIIGLGAVIAFVFTIGMIGTSAYGVVSSLGRSPSPHVPVELSDIDHATAEEEPSPARAINDGARALLAEATREARAFRSDVADAAERLRKEQATKKISEAFLAIESKPSKARAFIARYKGNPDAEENGFVAAAWRIINERMIYDDSNITKCGDCWCLVEPPLLAADTSPTH